MAEYFQTDHNLTEATTAKGIALTMTEADLTGTDIYPYYFNNGCSVAADAFGINTARMDPIEKVAFAVDVASHLRDHHVIFAYNLQGEPQGFGSFDLIKEGGKNMLYVSGLVIKKESQKHGVGTAIVTQALSSAQAAQPVDYIAGRTQNPVVAQARMHYCEPVYPITAKPDEEVVRMGHALHAHLEMQGAMDPLTLVTKDAYPQPLMKKRPQSQLPALNAFFKQYVGPRDAAFIIGRPKI